MWVAECLRGGGGVFAGVRVVLSPTGAVTKASGVGTPTNAAPQFGRRTVRVTLRVTRCPTRRLNEVLGLDPGLVVRDCRHFRGFRSTRRRPLRTLLTCANIMFGGVGPGSFARTSFHFTRSRLQLISVYCNLLHPLSLVGPCQVRCSIGLPRLKRKGVCVC